EAIAESPQLEGDEDLGDAAGERDDPDVDDEEDDFVAERPGDPEGEEDLQDPEHQLNPPEIEVGLRDERDRQVEDPLDEQEEPHERRKGGKGIVRVRERPDAGDDE